MLLLASASPRRGELLAAAGIAFDLLPVNIDETSLPAETGEAHVRRLAEQKARAAHAMRPDTVVLGADTTVVVDGRILGKPADAEEAREMLRALSGRAHDVLTGVALIAPQSQRLQQGPDPSVTFADIAVASTRVWFSAMTNEDIDWYVASGEPMDKAGAYAIQGLASRFIDRIEGSYSNVVGLPVAVVHRMLSSVPGFRHKNG